MTDNFVPVPTEELERLVLDAKMGCIGKPHAPGHKKGCDRCWSDERIGAFALPLADELVALRKWETQALAALEAAEKALARMIDTLNDKRIIVGGSGSALAEVRTALATITGGRDGFS